jgi:hypothetical protein
MQAGGGIGMGMIVIGDISGAQRRRARGEERTDGEDHRNMEGGGERMERVRKMGEYGTRGDRSKKDRTGARGGNGS